MPVQYSGSSIESAVVKNFFAAYARNGQRCIHFITRAVIAMSDFDFGAYPSMPAGRSWHLST